MSRRTLALVAAMLAIAGCGTFRKTFGIRDTPAHREPTTTSIWGNWVLRNPDSTAFAGANLVEMELAQGAFTITAHYPARPTVVVRGTAAYDGSGSILALTPTSGVDPSSTNWQMIAIRPGETVTLVASAAGNTLVFAPPVTSSSAAQPSSVWARKHAAEAAGIVVKDSMEKK